MFLTDWFRKKKVQLETPYGTITGTKTVLPKVSESTRELTPDEIEMKDTYIAGAETFANNFGLVAKLDADSLDELLNRWDPVVDDPVTFEETARTIGFAFGEYLVERYRMQWMVLTDEYGSDFIVRESATGCTTFPLSVVAKRLESGERDFMGPVAFALQKQIQDGQRRTAV